MSADKCRDNKINVKIQLVVNLNWCGNVLVEN